MKHTLIIGAASGLGRLWAQREQQAGHTVVLADRDATALADLTASRTAHCDITHPPDIERLFADHTFDRVVLTAAIMPTSPALQDDLARIQHIMDVNYIGAVRVLQAALPAMVARRTGEVVVFGSVAGEVPTPHMSAYGASKAALALYVETLQMELSGTGVFVRLVLPPMTDTPLLQQARTTSNPRSFEVGRRQGIVAKPEDVVDGAFLAVQRGRDRIYPHRMARALHYARRFLPGLLRRLVWKSEYEA